MPYPRLLQELEATLQIDVLAGDGGNLFGRFRSLRIPSSFLMLQEAGEDEGVVKDDAIGEQPAAF